MKVHLPGVFKNPFDKHKRFCIDYTQTVNQYIELDMYPLPQKQNMVHNFYKYSAFSKFDLKNSYHQMPIMKPCNIIKDNG